MEGDRFVAQLQRAKWEGNEKSEREKIRIGAEVSCMRLAAHSALHSPKSARDMSSDM
jgi:hypothetical protein